MGVMTASDATVDEHVLVRALWRAVDVFRCLALFYAVYAVWHRHHEIANPWGAVAVLSVLTAWTAVQTIRPMRTVRAYSVELAIACAAIALTRMVDSETVIVAGAKTLPSIWPAAAVVGAAILLGWRGGVGAAAIVAVFAFAEVGTPTGNTITNSILLLLLGGCLGYCVDLARASHAALSEAMRRDAARAERDRLARTVHDGVLQTLSYIHRAAADLGGDAATLGAMAGEQERILRTLVGQDDFEVGRRGPAGECDLRGRLRHVENPLVDLVTPAAQVMVPRRVADEVVAAVEAALDNVRKHAGEAARCWVLIDDDGHGVSVTIRDTGAGLPTGRLQEAVTQGRMGISSSILARIADLGGSARVTSSVGGGTTVELRVPSEAP